jgi:hypothetical protein
MAFYKNEAHVKKSTSDAYDKEHKPGQPTPHSGIYRCPGCGREDVSETGKPLPSQNHKQHTASQGPIRWKLLVWSEGDPK